MSRFFSTERVGTMHNGSKRRRFCLLGLAVLLLAAIPNVAAGQELPVTEGIDASREQVILELFDAMDLENQSRAAMRQQFQGANTVDPRLVKVLEEFLDRYVTWEVMRPELVRIYAEAFTDAEIRELTTFYRSPIGQTLLERTPMLNGMMIETMSDLVTRNQAELQSMIMEAMGGF